MSRAIVSKPTLDTLIRAKIAHITECDGVEPLPVTWRREDESGCNWMIPGWAGEVNAVSRCRSEMQHYLRFLRTQFNIPDER